MQNHPPNVVMTDYASESKAEKDKSPQPKGNDVASSIIPYNNPKALIGYYLGVFSILGYVPLIGIIGTLMGLAAFVLGIQALSYAKVHPEAKGKVHAWIAILAGGFFGATSGLMNGFLIYSMMTTH
jgi:hypothetical protein